MWIKMELFFLATDCSLIGPDRFGKPLVDRIGNESVPDRDFIEIGKRLDEISEIIEIEVVAGVDTESNLASRARSLDVRSDGSLGVGGKEVGVGLCVKLDPVGADGSRGGNIGGVGVDENARANASVAETVDDGRKQVGISLDIPTLVRCESVRSVGHEGDLSGMDFDHQIEEFGRRIALDIELAFDKRTQTIYVVVPDMALVGPRMYGDTVGPESFAFESKLLEIGDILTASVAERGNLIYID